MNILVTGAAGFIGSHVAEALLARGETIAGLDNFNDYYDPARKRANIGLLMPNPRFTLHEADVRNTEGMRRICSEGKFDAVIHLAAMAGVRYSMKNGPLYADVNVGGTVSLMEAMRDVGVRRVVFVSSGAVYGDQGEQPLVEEATPDPRSPYAVSKIAAEYYVRTIGDLWGIETVSLRVFNAYGPGQNIPASHAPVIPNFLRQAMRGSPLVIHGDGSQTRDYVFVDDVVSALISAATAPNLDDLVINVGSGREVSIRELVRLVIDVTAVKAETILNPRSDPGVSRMCADLSLARVKLGYQPHFSLEQGLRLTIERDPRFKKERVDR